MERTEMNRQLDKWVRKDAERRALFCLMAEEKHGECRLSLSGGGDRNLFIDAFVSVLRTHKDLVGLIAAAIEIYNKQIPDQGAEKAPGQDPTLN